jgi:hypothetical protein
MLQCIRGRPLEHGSRRRVELGRYLLATRDHRATLLIGRRELGQLVGHVVSGLRLMAKQAMTTRIDLGSDVRARLYSGGVVFCGGG